jgi:hypothetical protein
MYEGSCLCGAVRYEITGELGPIYLCHCSRCRKATGSAFNSGTPIQKQQFHLITGQETLKEFESSPGVHRVFCGACGSPLYSKRDTAPERLGLRIGTLDTPIPDKPSAHIFVADKAEWFDIHDGLPQYPERPE